MYAVASALIYSACVSLLFARRAHHEADGGRNRETDTIRFKESASQPQKRIQLSRQLRSTTKGLETLLFSSSSLATRRPILAAVARPLIRRRSRCESTESATISSRPVSANSDMKQTRGQVQYPELDEWRDFEVLRGDFDPEAFKAFFVSRPQAIAGRFIRLFTALNKARSDWDSANETETAAWNNQQDLDPVAYERGEASSTSRGKKLCATLSSLGPISVKVAQTLSQRPDIVGDEVAVALKQLQTANVPYDDRLAWVVIKESLNWKGPIAPGVGIHKLDEPGTPPLFANISEAPMAVASLGQVYKALTHEGVEVAVKVQRPDALAILAKDYVCFFVFFEFLRATGMFKAGNPGDIAKVIARVAGDILAELNYFKEAKNGVRFQESLDFLGFVTTPPVISKYSGEKVLVTEWVKGQPLSKLPVEDGLQMVRMAVEACTASLILTGYVHADPHEGNLMLADDGRLVFLDFGLMSDVDDNIMEAFARGIQACLGEDWYALSVAFKDTGFLTTPVRYRPPGKKEYVDLGIDPKTGEDLGLTKFTGELEVAMKTTEGGTSRFGALADVLNNKLSPRWRMFTPPYVLLLIRTFLTLEGIAGQVDSEFNIYETAMPWAVRRLFSPSSSAGIATFRSTLLTPDNRVQWNRLLELAQTNTSKSDDEQDSHDEAEPSAFSDAINALLGSPSGSALRRALMDVDSTDFLMRMISKEARALRHAAVLSISGAITNWWKARPETARKARPTSNAALLLKKRQLRWQRTVTRLLLRTHFRRLFKRGLKGFLALGSLMYLSLRISLGAVCQAALQILKPIFRRSRWSSQQNASRPVSA